MSFVHSVPETFESFALRTHPLRTPAPHTLRRNSAGHSVWNQAYEDRVPKSRYIFNPPPVPLRGKSLSLESGYEDRVQKYPPPARPCPINMGKMVLNMVMYCGGRDFDHPRHSHYSGVIPHWCFNNKNNIVDSGSVTIVRSAPYWRAAALGWLVALAVG